MNFLDLFSGIGGFHLGLEQAGFDFEWVGFSEIDKYANATYKKNFPDSVDLGDVRAIRHEDLPKIDIITFGSPCQDFSIAGKRSGMQGNRSTLITEAIRLITDTKPRFFIWENVKGTFSSNDGRDFWAIIKAFADIGGYRLEWQLLNTRWFLPQNRERIYLIGHLGDGGGSKIFPVGEDSEKSNKGKQGRVEIQTAQCLNARMHKIGRDDNYIKTSLNQIGTIGKDSESTRVYDTTCARTIKDGGGMGAKTGLYQVKSNIRRLTPTECERLQGFPDGFTAGQSDTQRYKQLGNAVSVPVVKAVGTKIRW